jgi:hypothetical protein
LQRFDLNNLSLEQEAQIAKVRQGIDLITSLFESAGQSVFPRKMAVGQTFGITVESKEQMLYQCIKGNFIDCRINAYYEATDSDFEAGLVPPSIIFVDIDLKAFNDNKNKLDKALQNTLNKIKTVLGVSPIVLWSGNGYHIYLGISTRPLKYIKELADKCKEPSKEFLRFVPNYLTDKKCDPVQPASFKSYHLRIPNTFNGKNGANTEVILANSDYQIAKPNKILLTEFNLYLAQLPRDKRKKQVQKKYSGKTYYQGSNWRVS